jgi:hypothetical protein
MLIKNDNKLLWDIKECDNKCDNILSFITLITVSQSLYFKNLSLKNQKLFAFIDKMINFFVLFLW